MEYDFNTVIDRKNTNSLKYDFAVERGRPADVLPLWVADMDFRAPEPVLKALRNAVFSGTATQSGIITRPSPPGFTSVSAGRPSPNGW